MSGLKWKRSTNVLYSLNHLHIFISVLMMYFLDPLFVKLELGVLQYLFMNTFLLWYTICTWSNRILTIYTFSCFLSSMQKKRTRAWEGGQRKRVQKAQAGLHRCSTSNSTCNIQRKQAPIQRIANNHFPAAGSGADHGQQLLYECTQEEPG